MAFWDTVGRVGLAVGTGGLSEVARAADGLLDKATPDINIKGLGKTKTDDNIEGYDVPPDIAAAYADIGDTQYTPRDVKPAFSVGAIAKDYAFSPEQVASAFQNQTFTNQDATQQYAIQQQQLAEANRLQGVALGAFTPADRDNLSLLGQGQRFQTSLANTARGGTEQRLAAQRDAQVAVSGLAQNNIATLAAQRAQEQADARQQLSQVLGQTQGLDQGFVGAAYNIANADATRNQQATVANQEAATQAQIAAAAARVSAAGVDQNANFNTTAANQNATTQAYRDQTARTVAAGQGVQAARNLQTQADAGTTQAQQTARQDQLTSQELQLQLEEAKKQRDLKKVGAVAGAVGTVAGVALRG